MNRSEVAFSVQKFTEARDACNVVLGALLGAYIGLALTQTGLKAGSKLDFFFFLLSTIWFVMAINNCGDRIHRKELRWGVAYAVFAIFTAAISLSHGAKLGVDPAILATAYAVWVFVILVEVAGPAISLIRKAKS